MSPFGVMMSNLSVREREIDRYFETVFLGKIRKLHGEMN